MTQHTQGEWFIDIQDNISSTDSNGNMVRVANIPNSNWKSRRRLMLAQATNAVIGKKGYQPVALTKRFNEKYMPEPMSGCWLWLGSKTQHGYGQIWLNGRIELAHRISYEMFCAEIPATLEIDHLCKNKSCVNPAHLEAVTHQVNTQRAYPNKAAIAAAKGK